MTTYNRLKKIIPPDQALANQALSRSLRQIKDIFNTNLPEVAQATSSLELNKDLNLINDLPQPLPDSVQNFWGDSFATGTGPGNTITTNDVIGIAAGATVNTALPEVTVTVQELANIGALNPLTGNGGTPGSANNGVYTVMQYCLAGAYTSIVTDPMTMEEQYVISIPNPLPGAGTYGPDPSLTAVFDQAFTQLVSVGNATIANIANAYPEQASICNTDTNAMANQLALNVTNSIAAGIDIGNVVNDIANANLVANSVSTSLGIASRLHDIGLDITSGGAAQFFESVADFSTLSGQAVVASMREGRNIAILNAVGIQTDTQITDTNPNQTVANNLSSSQFTVTEARANIII
jgi:hypothetical protein